jgi:hypothetical protein
LPAKAGCRGSGVLPEAAQMLRLEAAARAGDDEEEFVPFRITMFFAYTIALASISIMFANAISVPRAVVRKFSFHWDGIPFYEGELPSLFR